MEQVKQPMPEGCVSGLVEELEGWHEEVAELTEKAVATFKEHSDILAVQYHVFIVIAFQQALIRALKNFQRQVF